MDSQPYELSSNSGATSIAASRRRIRSARLFVCAGAVVELSLLPQPVNLGEYGGRFLRQSLAASGIDLEVALVGISERQKEAGMTLIAADGDLIWSVV